MRRHLLVDASVAVAAFAPETTRSDKLRLRSGRLIHGDWASTETVFLIPNFCIAEVFSAFEKYRWGRHWNTQVTAQHCLTPRRFRSVRDDFHSSIHNGKKLLQVELNRYHILCVDLIAPVNAAYQIRRPGKKGRTVRPASTYDLLFIATGIWLQKQLGAAEFAMVTGDRRLTEITRRAASATIQRPLRNHLGTVASTLGLTFSEGIYPRVINLTADSQGGVRRVLPDW